MIDLEGVQAVQLAMIAHCELMGDRVAILDAPPGLNAQQVKEWRVDKAGYDSQVRDAVLAVDQGHRPAAGHRRSSSRRAATWPASGRATTTRAACTRHRPTRSSAARSRSSCSITKGEHDQLNPIGINCIRAFPGRGIRVWGARTLSSDPAWRYLNVRRLFNYVEESILDGHPVGRVRAERPEAVGARSSAPSTRSCAGSGATARSSARTPGEAFFVKCDAENNPPEDRSTPASSIVEIGIAPVKPAEFVVFRIASSPAAPAVERVRRSAPMPAGVLDPSMPNDAISRGAVLDHSRRLRDRPVLRAQRHHAPRST